MCVHITCLSARGGGGGGGGGDGGSGDDKSFKPVTKLATSPTDWFRWQKIDFDKLNPNVNLNQACSQFTDCYNCTLSGCGWGTEYKKCVDKPGVNRSETLNS